MYRYGLYVEYLGSLFTVAHTGEQAHTQIIHQSVTKVHITYSSLIIYLLQTNEKHKIRNELQLILNDAVSQKIANT